MEKISKLFLVAGVMRSGTTWLYNVIKDHPDLYFTPQKELHFLYDFYNRGGREQSLELPLWDRQYITSPPTYGSPEDEDARRERLEYLFKWGLLQLGYNRDYDYYNRLFSLRGREAYCCDMSNLTSHISQEGLADIKERFGNVKVALVLRDPLYRLWSHFVYTCQRSHEGPFDESHWGEDRIRKWLSGGNRWVPGCLNYVETVDKLDSVFGDDFALIFYEDMLLDIKAVLKKLEEFLEIPPFNYSDSKINKVVNLAAGLSEPWESFKRVAEPHVISQINQLAANNIVNSKWYTYDNSSSLYG